MREQEAFQEIKDRVRVTQHFVAVAKSFLISQDFGQRDSVPVNTLVREFARAQGFDKTDEFVVHPTVDPQPQIAQTSGYISCELSLVQALWELVHNGTYMYVGTLRDERPSQAWTTVVAGSGTSSSWNFQEFHYGRPDNVMPGPRLRSGTPDTTTDPDLFILESGLEGAHAEVAEAAADAVRCLRHELYRPAVTMLGKVMEGAWIELGVALAAKLPNSGEPKPDDFKELMQSDNTSIARKIDEVRKLYERREILGPIYKTSAIRPAELQSAVIWSDVVRESRNAIHFGASPTIANSYEKVAVLFLDGAQCLAKIYAIKEAADQA